HRPPARARRQHPDPRHFGLGIEIPTEQGDDHWVKDLLPAEVFRSTPGVVEMAQSSRSPSNGRSKSIPVRPEQAVSACHFVAQRSQADAVSQHESDRFGIEADVVFRERLADPSAHEVRVLDAVYEVWTAAKKGGKVGQ